MYFFESQQSLNCISDWFFIFFAAYRQNIFEIVYYYLKLDKANADETAFYPRRSRFWEFWSLYQYEQRSEQSKSWYKKIEYHSNWRTFKLTRWKTSINWQLIRQLKRLTKIER
jgi:hypothetical protein